MNPSGPPNPPPTADLEGAFFDLTSDPMGFFAEDGSLVKANRPLARLLNQAPDPDFSRPGAVLDWVVDADREGFEEMWAGVLRGRSRQNQVLRLRQKPDSERWSVWNLAYEPVQRLVLVSLRDITAIRNLNQDLQQETRLLTAFLQHASIGLVMEDSSGHIVLANDAFCRLVCPDSAPHRLRGQPIGEMLPVGLKPGFEATAQRIRAGDGLVREDLAMHVPDGRERRVRVTRFPVGVDRDQTLGIGTILLDITAETDAQRHQQALIAETTRLNEALNRKMEEAQEMAMNAEVANRVKTNFLAVMSHELRTPLNAVIGFAELLGLGDLSEEQAEYVQIIQEGGEDLLKLVDSILEYTRLGSETAPFAYRSLPLKETVDEVVGIYRGQIAQKGLKCSVVFADECPETIRTEPNRFRQILSNLLSNAYKFTPSGWISVHFSVEEDGGVPSLVGEVVDTGIGIPQDKLQAIFRPFTQVDDSLSRRYSGIGMGLTICQQIIERLGGSIHCQSQIGEGTQLRFTLPLASSGEAPDSSLP
ncbi:MAG: PAS domain-containing sensor histidine kinase [Opitutales bacterium]